jgi:MFS family permease
MMVGAVVAGMFQDRFGRRWSLALGSVLSAVAVAICYVANLHDEIDSRRGIFFAGKLAHGFAIGMVICTAQTFMSEILPPKLRGPILAFFPIFILLGQLAGAVVVFSALKIEGSKSYTIPFLSQWPFSAILLVVSGLVPESPAYLMRKNQFDAASKALKRLNTEKVDIGQELERLRVSVQTESQQAGKAKYTSCFKGTDRRRTLIVIFSHILPQIFGIALLSNASYFMQVVGMSAKNSLLFLQLGIGLGLIANIASLWTLNVTGRRPLILLTLAISALLWLCMGIAGCFKGIVMIWYVQDS